MVEPVFSVIGDVQIVPVIVVVVTDANPLAPTGRFQAGFYGDVSKRAVVIVSIEVVGRRFTAGRGFKRSAVHDENIWPAVIVIVENGNAGAGGLDDVLLGANATEDVHHGEPGFFGNVFEICDAWSL